MRSYVTKLYDYTKEPIPEEMGKWEISDEEIRQQLEMLSANHAYEEEADTVALGDSVRCAAKGWNGSLLLYPGEKIHALEERILGMKKGESRTLEAGGEQMTVTVEKILRRSCFPVSDALVQKEAIEGVSTVEDYYRWYRQSKSPERKQRAAANITSYLGQKLVEKSVLSIDREEKAAWLQEWVDVLYRSLLEAGMDPRIPEEGFDFLTEEQAKEKMFGQYQHFFDSYLVHLELIRYLSGRDPQEYCQEKLAALAQANQVSVDVIYQQSGRSQVMGSTAYNEALMLLMEHYAQQFVEE